MERVEHTLEPFYNDDSRILILGSMPSPKSRETGFYYGHPQNRFWRVMAEVLSEELPDTIDEKKAMLRKHGIALWDVLKNMRHQGARRQQYPQSDCQRSEYRFIVSRDPSDLHHRNKSGGVL